MHSPIKGAAKAQENFQASAVSMVVLKVECSSLPRDFHIQRQGSKSYRQLTQWQASHTKLHTERCN